MEVQPESDAPQFEVYQNRCLENGKKMYLNTNTRDVCFLFGEEGNITAIPAHKAILATDSDVFERMFYGGLKEPGDIHVRDSTAAAFKEFLQYFYLSEVKLTADNMVDVLHLGAKYNIKKCVNNCVRSLICALDDENVFNQLQLAIMYDQKEWIKVCEKRINKNCCQTDLLFNSLGFLKCDKTVLAHILKMDDLLCTEMDVFKACMSWVKEKSHGADLSMELVELHLGESFYDIRLASLTMKELSSLYLQYESVLARDFTHIALIISLPEIQNPKFKKHPRRAKWDENAIIKCKRENDEEEERREHHDHHSYSVHSNVPVDSCDGSCGFLDSWLMNSDECQRDLNAVEEITFSVNEPLLLGSLSCIQIRIDEYNLEQNIARECCDSISECARDFLQTEMEIVEATDVAGANCNTLLKMKIDLQTEERLTDIPLPHPILIRSSLFYTIHFGKFSNNIGFYYCTNRKDTASPGSNIMVKFHKNYKYSPIEALNFNKI